MVDVSPVNQAGILSAGQDLVHNLLNQEINRSLGQAQVEQAQAQTAMFRQKAASDLLEQQQQAQMQREVGVALQSGDPSAISKLIARYPQYKDGLKTAYDQMDGLQQRSELRQAAGIWSALNAGNTDAAIKQLEGRVTADREAGHDTADDEEQIAMLKSGDPKAVNTVKGKLGLFMASVVPDKFASVVEQLGTGNDATRKGQVVGRAIGHYDDNGNWVTDYRDPEPGFTLSEGQTRFEPGGGTPGTSGSTGPLSVASVAPHIVAQESSGNYSAVNRETGAMGAFQVMPATAQTLAARLGMAWNPGLMISDSEAGRQYQDRIGQAAVQEAIDASGGDPATMAAYYHGGSDRSKWGPRTQKYASEVVARLGGGQGGAAPIASVPKAPAQQTRILSPQEVAAIPGLDPQTVYQQSKEGTITSVGGQKQGQLKPLPAPVLQARASNVAALRNIDSALSLLDPKNKTAAAKNARNAIGTGTGMLGDTFSQWHDPDGTDFRAQIGQIGGLIIKDTSGAAVSVSEDQRLAKWVPKVTDTPTAATAKLKNLKREIAQRNQAIADTFNEDQGYRPIDGGGSAPVRVRSVQEANALKPGTLYVRPDGKVMRR